SRKIRLPYDKVCPVDVPVTIGVPLCRCRATSFRKVGLPFEEIVAIDDPVTVKIAWKHMGILDETTIGRTAWECVIESQVACARDCRIAERNRSARGKDQRAGQVALGDQCRAAASCDIPARSDWIAPFGTVERSPPAGI